MNGIQLQNINLLYLLWIIPVIIGVAVFGTRKRKTVLILFKDSRRRIRGYRTGIVFVVLSAVFLVLAAVRPAWNPQKVTVESKGRDVVFMVDVSYSMLAEDLKPSRLEGAKLAVLDTLKDLSGDRVALIAFAGNPAILCPLTLDYDYFSFSVKNMSPDSVTLGGTNLGLAFDKVRKDIFGYSSSKYRDIILITDGEDHGTSALQEAGKLGKDGIRLIVIGIGDDKTGKRIPLTDQEGNKRFLTYRGQEVWTKLDSATLRKAAAETPGGGFVKVGVQNFDLADIYRKYIASEKGRDTFTQTLTKYEEKYQIFLFTAFLLLLAESFFFLELRKKRKDINDEE